MFATTLSAAQKREGKNSCGAIVTDRIIEFSWPTLNINFDNFAF